MKDEFKSRMEREPGGQSIDYEASDQLQMCIHVNTHTHTHT